MAAQLHFGTGDSTTFGTTGTTTSGTMSFNKSDLANMQVGDLLVAWVHDQSSASNTITAPTGWSRYGAAFGSPDAQTTRNSNFYYYPIKASTDISGLQTSPTWSFTSGGRLAGVVARATGIDLDVITDTAATAFSGGGSGTSLTISGITTSNATTLLIGGLHHQNSASTVSPTTTAFMTAFQEYKTSPTGSANANTGAAMGYTYLTSAGATGSVVATFDSSNTVVAGELVAFKVGPWSPPSGTGTRPAIVGTPTTFTNQNSSTSFTISTPVGLQDGDALILAVAAQTPSATSDFSSSGWSRIGQAFTSSSTTNRLTAFYALPLPTAASAASSYTFSNTDSSTGGRVCATMVVVRNADLTNLVIAYSPYGNFSGSTETIVPGPISYNNSLLLLNYNSQWVSGADYTVGTAPNATSLVNSLITSTGAVSKTGQNFYQQNVDAGTPPSYALTWNGTPAQGSGLGVVIHAKGQASTNSGVPVKYTSATDTLSSASLFYTSATDTLSTPKEVRPVPKGYASVSAMLASNPMYVAHRGGSADWPEMSLYGYTQSVFWGVGALEVSLGRSSDGVWFGLHDASLDRTSLNSGGGSGTTLIANSMTWAQIQQYQIQYPNINNPSTYPKPYMRWEEIIAAYYNTHVIFVDPKNNTAYANELLNMMDALGNTPTQRFIAKQFGPSGGTNNTSGWAFAAAQRGYKSWGYFYETDYNNVPTYQGRYDILGMDYTATSASWTQIMSYGKPVLAHIVPTAAAATTAFGYGANGLMASGIQEATPRSS